MYSWFHLPCCSCFKSSLFYANQNVEEHRLYSLCYLQLGAPRVWYGIPGKHGVKFELALKNSFADMLEEKPQFQHRLVSYQIL